jgi:hypothetical protein
MSEKRGWMCEVNWQPGEGGRGREREKAVGYRFILGIVLSSILGVERAYFYWASSWPSSVRPVGIWDIALKQATSKSLFVYHSWSSSHLIRRCQCHNECRGAVGSTPVSSSGGWSLGWKADCCNRSFCGFTQTELSVVSLKLSLSWFSSDWAFCSLPQTELFFVVSLRLRFSLFPTVTPRHITRESAVK